MTVPEITEPPPVRGLLASYTYGLSGYRRKIQRQNPRILLLQVHTQRRWVASSNKNPARTLRAVAMAGPSAACSTACCNCSATCRGQQETELR